eukprot:TRINITY_DN10355_c0_g2_i3.p1 TRINITY_DN10355_c0_g2~~TRINITY_DN10355_c0_g2_i3.p1  ORF type:complete len:336 (+),score=26.13 TRINITY_DN10355_c0_g2_i3:1045-2052(+)
MLLSVLAAMDAAQLLPEPLHAHWGGGSVPSAEGDLAAGGSTTPPKVPTCETVRAAGGARPAPLADPSTTQPTRRHSGTISAVVRAARSSISAEQDPHSAVPNLTVDGARWVGRAARAVEAAEPACAAQRMPPRQNSGDLTMPLLTPSSSTVDVESARACCSSGWDPQVTAVAAALLFPAIDRRTTSERLADAYPEAPRSGARPTTVRDPPQRSPYGPAQHAVNYFPGAAIYATPFVAATPASTLQGEDTDMPPLVGDRPVDRSEVTQWLEDRTIQPTAETSDFHTELYDDGVRRVQDLRTLAACPRFAEVVPEAGARRRIKAALRAERHAGGCWS